MKNRFGGDGNWQCLTPTKKYQSFAPPGYPSSEHHSRSRLKHSNQLLQQLQRPGSCQRHKQYCNKASRLSPLLAGPQPPKTHIFPSPSMTAVCPFRACWLVPLGEGVVHVGAPACCAHSNRFHKCGRTNKVIHIAWTLERGLYVYSKVLGVKGSGYFSWVLRLQVFLELRCLDDPSALYVFLELKPHQITA